MNNTPNTNTESKPPFKILGISGASIWEFIKVVTVSLAIVLPIRYFVVQPFYVKGASMEPNFHDYEYLIIDELSYRFHEPARGDVVVLKDPYDSSKYFIKRIVGLPGDQVQLENGKVIVNGKELDETAYLDASVETYGVPGLSNVTLQSDQYFVMGDNRAASLDSRRFGAIPKSEFVGRVAVRLWPLNKWNVY